MQRWGASGGAPGQPGVDGTPPVATTCGGTGGGGGGTGGGTGGNGGVSPVGNNNGSGGNGGTGGAHGHTIDTLDDAYNNNGTVAGGAGELGGTAADAVGDFAGGGGGGGAGGYGVVANQKSTVTNSAGGTIKGGTGGTGGSGGNSAKNGNAGDGGDGGDGGIGVWVNANNISVSNSSIIQGGNGGDAGLSGKAPNLNQGSGTYYEQGGDPGTGGAGIDGSGKTGTSLTNDQAGQILGGDGGASVSQAQSVITVRKANGNRGGDGVINILTVHNHGTIHGGNGSSAKDGSTFDIGVDPGAGVHFKGANGGAGGNGVALNTGTGSIDSSGEVHGGHGGDGGIVAAGYSNNSGNGGAGGTGVLVTTGTSVTNAGTISGGDGGAGAAVTNTDVTNGNGGDAGDGIRGAGITVINSGTIKAGSGGAAGSGIAGTDGIAVHLLAAAAGNTLEIRQGSIIQGVATAEGTNNVFVLGGTQDASFSDTVSSTIDQSSAFQGFQTYRKTGTSTWKLQSTYRNDWEIRGGTLQVDDSGKIDDVTTVDTGIGNETGFLAYNQSSGVITSFGGQIAGAGGFRQAGEGTVVLTNAGNSYTGGTELDAGVISVADDKVLGNENAGLTFNGGVLQVTGTLMTSTGRTITWGAGGGGFDIDDLANVFTVSQNLSAGGALTKAGAGTLILKGTNSYTGGTTVSGGTLQVAKDTNLGDAAGSLTIDNATFQNTQAMQTNRAVIVTGAASTFQTDTDLTVTGTFDASGSTSWHKTGTGELIFDVPATGDVGLQANIDAGKVTVKGTLSNDFVVNNGGILTVDGTQNGNINVNSGGSLMGAGTITRDVTVANAGILQGQHGQTLTIAGNLELNATSSMNVTLAIPSQTALYDIGGDVTLDGRLNITDGGGFGAGLYRLITYQGGLIDNTMEIGSTPTGSDPNRLWIDTDTVNKQVNLMSATGVHLNIWDGGDPANRNNGQIDGGDGIWNLISDHSNDAWTDNEERINGPYDQGSFAVFSVKPGTVTIDDNAGDITAAGLQFTVDGYTLKGDALTLDNF